MIMEQHNNTALLVMDLQPTFFNMVPGATAIAGNVAKAIAHARSHNVPVIYVVVGFRKGTPEISANNKGFTTARQMLANVDMAELVKIHPDVAPYDNEVVVTKRRVSAFSGSDLEVVLRAFNIQHLVLTGIATSGVVLSTVREAADKDYRITVLEDCCGDADPEVHRVLTTKIFPRQADVMSHSQWIG